MADGAEGLSGIERRLDSLATAIMKQTEQVAGMSAEMKSFMNKELAAKQRLEIRDETQTQIKEAIDAQEKTAGAARALESQKALAASKEYTDEQVAALVAELASREERDQRLESRVQRQQIAMAGMVVVIIVYVALQQFGAV